MSGGEPAEELDKLAARAVERAAPVCFDLARTAEEREATYRLRYRAIVEQGWLQAADLPDGREWEPVDETATHMIGRLGDHIVASSRLVVPGSGQPLPLAETFELDKAIPGGIAQLDRVCVARECSDGRNRVMIGLLAANWLEIRRRGLSLLAAIQTSAVLRLCRLIGFTCEPIGPARWYWGEERFPVIFTPQGALPTFRRRVMEETPMSPSLGTGSGSGLGPWLTRSFGAGAGCCSGNDGG